MMSTDELLMNYGRSSGELTDLKRRTSEHWSIVGVAGAFLDEDPAMEVLVLRGVAGVAGEGDAGAYQVARKALVLVVRQGVHRVEDERLDAGTRMLETVVQNRDEEGLGLTRAGAAGDNRVAPGQDLLDRLLLMTEERPFAERRVSFALLIDILAGTEQ